MKTKPMKHQEEGLARMKGKRNFALFMEQGTGKTWLSLADLESCYMDGKVDGALVVAPKGVHTNWVRREIPTHVEVPTELYCWKGRPGSNVQKKKLEEVFKPWVLTNRRRPMRVLSMNIEALNTAAGLELAERFLKDGKMMIIMDESTRIKNPKAQRTKKAIKVAQLAIARRILSGTPMPRAPGDLFSQFEFLKKGLLGTTSYSAFVREYTELLDPSDPEMIAIMSASGSKFPPQIPRKDEWGRPIYKNLDQLARMIQPHSYRVKKEDCLDLPPKVYKAVYFELTNAQRKVYEQLENDYSYLFVDEDMGMSEEMSFASIAARTKMKQVTSGFINIYGEPVLLPPEDNPRFDAFTSWAEDMMELYPDDQFIVWAMFDQELEQLYKWLKDKGESVGTYKGDTKDSDREALIDDFQAGKVRWFLGNAAAGGIGITLTAAQWTAYYSCSFDNELRLQSEDRNHRIGTKGTVTYFDFIGESTLDEEILRNLDHKNKTAAAVIDAPRQ